MPSENLLIAIYFSHFFVFSYKNSSLGRESLMSLEYHKKFENFLAIFEDLWDIKKF